MFKISELINKLFNELEIRIILNRPLGIIVISSFSIYVGILCLKNYSAYKELNIISHSNTVSLLSLMYIIWGVVLLISAYGIYSLSPWGLQLSSKTYIISIPLSIFLFIFEDYIVTSGLPKFFLFMMKPFLTETFVDKIINFLEELIYVGMYFLIVLFLSRANVKNLFIKNKKGI